MCCCGRPTINGEPGAYSWDGKTFMTATAFPPAPRDGEEVVYDEPGRCGGMDCHSHHFQLVKSRGDLAVRVRHGGGEEAFSLRSCGRLFAPSFALLDSNARYWLLHMLYSVHSDAGRAADEKARQEWRVAAAEKRIRTRKVRGRGAVKVWIEPAKQVQPAA